MQLANLRFFALSGPTQVHSRYMFHTDYSYPLVTLIKVISFYKKSYHPEPDNHS